MPLVNLRKPTDVPMVLDALEEADFLSDMAKKKILETYREDIKRAEERGRNEACDVFEHLSRKLRDGETPEGL